MGSISAQRAPLISLRIEDSSGATVEVRYTPEEAVALLQSLVSSIHLSRVDSYIRDQYPSMSFLVPGENGALKIKVD